MHEIDFLPAEYHQKYARRHAQPRRVLVLGSIIVMVAVAALGQHQRRARLEAQLAAIIPQYDAVTASKEDLKELESRLKLARADAELFTYLRHRWPTTQILDALLAPLPDEITFERLEMRRERVAGRPVSERVSRQDRETEARLAASLPPAARDLQHLRGQCDALKTVVAITGLTSDSAVLHRYLTELGKVKLFWQADLETIESDTAPSSSGKTKLRFSASLVVRPGYGQPGGPTGEPVPPGAAGGLETLNPQPSTVNAQPSPPQA